MSTEKPQEKELTKAEMFEKDPDSFIHLSEIIIAVKSNPENPLAPLSYIGKATEFSLYGASEMMVEKVKEHIYNLKMRRDMLKQQSGKITELVNQGNFRKFIKGKK